jgi:hypothetical protein
MSLLFPVLLLETEYRSRHSLKGNKKALVLTMIGAIIIMMPYKRIVINGYRQGFPTVEHDLGIWIRENTNPEDRVFSFTKGRGGIIMAYSDRLSPSKHFHLMFAESGKDRDTLLKELYSKLPEVIVVEYNRFNTWQHPDSSFMKQYKKVRSRGEFDVYFRIDKPLP